MQRGRTLRGHDKCKTLVLLWLMAGLSQAAQTCAGCHPKEVAGYEQTGMAQSLAPISKAPSTPDGAFVHEFSKTSFTIHSGAAGMSQSFKRGNESSEQAMAFVIGSGNHAFGYLVKVGDHLFQSPLSFYMKRGLWDVAPGYELDPEPDFSRPVTAECVLCHAGKSLPVQNTLNTFQPSVFEGYGISCERCHGDTAAHLKKPVPGSILNPAKLTGATRASICEQCHLTGETRIPSPGESISAFQPGQPLEDFYTTYIAAQDTGKSIKVVSQAEQLALSVCARSSGDRLWCGTCHNPHDKPVQPAAYFRERCLSCHGGTLEPAHAAPGRDCVGCHMPKLPAKDGGHTAFTNHRIARNAAMEIATGEPDTLKAWREPQPQWRERNLALALVTIGLQNQSAAEVIRGYRMLNGAVKEFPNDPALLTGLGSVLMKAKEPAEALKCFRKAMTIQPSYAPYYVNTATALVAMNQPAEAAEQLEKALTLDSLLQEAVRLLDQVYRTQGETGKAEKLMAQYDRAMGIVRH